MYEKLTKSLKTNFIFKHKQVKKIGVLKLKKCLYCQTELLSESVIDFCSKCGKGVFGEKMFNTIVKNMEDAKEKGDL